MHKCVSVFCLFDGKYSQDQRLKQQYRCPMRTNLWRGLFFQKVTRQKSNYSLCDLLARSTVNVFGFSRCGLRCSALTHTHTQASRSILFSRTTSVHPPVPWFTVLITIPVILSYSRDGGPAGAKMELGLTDALQKHTSMWSCRTFTAQTDR